MDYHIFFGVLAVAVSILGCIPYIRDMHLGKTKPNIASWGLWTLMTVIGVMAQLSDGAGAGAWSGIITTIICAYIVILAFKTGKKSMTKIDTFSLIISLIAIASWYLTNTPLYAVMLIIIADVAAFIPTIVKSFSKPYEETLTTYELAGVKHVFALIALNNFTFITAAYSIYLVIINIFFVSMLFWRRSVLKK